MREREREYVVWTVLYCTLYLYLLQIGKGQVPHQDEAEEVSVYDIKDHPDYKFRPGHVVVRVGGYEVGGRTPMCSTVMGWRDCIRKGILGACVWFQVWVWMCGGGERGSWMPWHYRRPPGDFYHHKV